MKNRTKIIPMSWKNSPTRSLRLQERVNCVGLTMRFKREPYHKLKRTINRDDEIKDVEIE